jgi:hypothetical protein
MHALKQPLIKVVPNEVFIGYPIYSIYTNKLMHCILKAFWNGLLWRAIFDFPILLVQLLENLD